MDLHTQHPQGVFFDYRNFDRYNITPRFHFGYDLSYTTFSFAKLKISVSAQYRQQRTRSYSNFGSSKLHEPAYEIKFSVTNTEKRNSSKVVQLYLGFQCVYLILSESKQVILILTQKDISYWNVEQ